MRRFFAAFERTKTERQLSRPPNSYLPDMPLNGTTPVSLCTEADGNGTIFSSGAGRRLRIHIFSRIAETTDSTSVSSRRRNTHSHRYAKLPPVSYLQCLNNV